MVNKVPLEKAQCHHPLCFSGKRKGVERQLEMTSVPLRKEEGKFKKEVWLQRNGKYPESILSASIQEDNNVHHDGKMSVSLPTIQAIL